MPNKTLPQKIKELGFCCTYAYLHLQQGTKQLTLPRFGATQMAARIDCSRKTIYNWRDKYKNGELCCEGQAKCLKGLWVGKEKDSFVHLTYRYPVLIVLSGHRVGTYAPIYTAKFRDLPELEVTIPPGVDLDIGLSEGLSDYMAHLIQQGREIPKASRIERGERWINVTPLMGPKLQDYLKAWTRKHKAPPIG